MQIGGEKWEGFVSMKLTKLNPLTRKRETEKKIDLSRSFFQRNTRCRGKGEINKYKETGIKYLLS